MWRRRPPSLRPPERARRRAPASRPCSPRPRGRPVEPDGRHGRAALVGRQESADAQGASRTKRQVLLRFDQNPGAAIEAFEPGDTVLALQFRGACRIRSVAGQQSQLTEPPLAAASHRRAPLQALALALCATSGRLPRGTRSDGAPRREGPGARACDTPREEPGAGAMTLGRPADRLISSGLDRRGQARREYAPRRSR